MIFTGPSRVQQEPAWTKFHVHLILLIQANQSSPAMLSTHQASHLATVAKLSTALTWAHFSSVSIICTLHVIFAEMAEDVIFAYYNNGRLWMAAETCSMISCWFWMLFLVEGESNKFSTSRQLQARSSISSFKEINSSTLRNFV